MLAGRVVPKHREHALLSPRPLHLHLAGKARAWESDVVARLGGGGKRARRRSAQACGAGCCQASAEPAYFGAAQAAAPRGTSRQRAAGR